MATDAPPAEHNVGDPRKLVETLASLAKRRGFIFPSSEIYGGVQAIYDFGPLGVELKRCIKNLWWRHVVELRHDVVGIETSVIMHPRVWEASGHVENFTDPLTDCKTCKSRWRADHLRSAARYETDGDELPAAAARALKDGKLDRDKPFCPNCGGQDFSDTRQFNLMFKTHIGPVEETAAQIFLRPETAQGMFVQFENVVNSTRKRVPFGIAQQGKSFRNEISPGNYIFRLREFEQMEMEFFCEPGTDIEWLEHWRDERMRWWTKVLGVREKNIRARPLEQDELAHYAAGAYEVEYLFPWGWGELEGIADRTDFDLKRHSEYSGKEIAYFDDATQKRYTPYVIEPAMGVDRCLFTLMIDAYDEEEVRGEKRVVLRFHPNVAPIQVAVLPLSKNADLTPTSRRVEELVRPHFRVEYDETQSIGRRYRRHDEIGTPYAVTIDFDTLTDEAVTIRERDSMAQERVPLTGLVDRLRDRFSAAG
ncbi:MAG TPA: glycine--tRNA ligase [Candidatus Dormibacteraeota bacterium]|nr:glycine--tRNA ligase [Candidatus Dormibacteraeota bacterium]